MHTVIRSLKGSEIHEHIEDLADLRLRVFREYPYLYDGDMAYEQEYLKKFSESTDALLLIVQDNSRVVGAGTVLPLNHAGDEYQTPFKKTGLDVSSYMYIGELLLDVGYRGNGLGSQLLKACEDHARSAGYDHTCFCGIKRPVHDSKRPPTYRDITPFYTRHGYSHSDNLVAIFHWKEIDEPDSSPKQMFFWTKTLH